MNKRAAPRFPVTLDIAVTFPGNVIRLCTLRDYCATGMYLLYADDESPAAQLARDDLVRIEFSNPMLLQATRHRLAGKVARVIGNGVGIAFSEQYPEAIADLSQLAESQSVSGRQVNHQGAPSDGRGNGLISRCRDMTEEHLQEVLPSFFTEVNESLQASGMKTKEGDRQSAFYSADNQLRQGKAAIATHFVELINEQYEILFTPGYRGRFDQKPAEQGELSLLDSKELDHWLAVRAMASKLEQELSDVLESLEIRFEAISANPITLENNPVGPLVIVSAFRAALEELSLDDVAVAVIFSTMGERLHSSLKKHYEELNEMLIAAGIVPLIERRLEVVKRPETAAPTGSSSTPCRDRFEADSQSYGGAGVSRGSQPYPAADLAVVAAQPDQTSAVCDVPLAVQAFDRISSHSDSQAGSAPAQAATPELTPMNYARPVNVATTDKGEIASGAAVVGTQPAVTDGGVSFYGVQQLMRLQQEITSRSANSAAHPAGVFSGNEVMQALGQLLTLPPVDRDTVESVGHAPYLQQKIAELTGDEGKILSDADNETVAYVGGMFSSILQDRHVASDAKPWFTKLEVPLLMAGLLDRSLLEDDGHPARQLLNRLESVGDSVRGDESEYANAVRARIEEILDAIPARVENDPNVFVDAISEVMSVEDQLKEKYERNIAQLIQPCKKESELNRARHAILDALNDRLGQREVPQVVLDLLDAGWKNLLLRTWLKSGGESDVYIRYLNVIDHLNARLMQASPYSSNAVMPDKTLLDWIERMLSVVSDDEEKNSRLLGTIAGHLSGASADTIETRYVPVLVSKKLRTNNRQQPRKPASVPAGVWQFILLDAGELQAGDTFGYTDEEKGELQAKLVWRDADEARYVFADNTGNKLLELDLGEVARLLYNKLLSRLDQKAMSVTERATFQFLSSLHNKLAHQARHDDLTGLINRKAFERELEEAVVNAKSGNTSHVLCYLDLDRFNIINSTCGHAEGDVLLGKVTRVLQDKLKDEALIGRLGGDEFGILFRNCSRSRGLQLATEVHDAIRDIHFRCENNEFKITASIGLVEINELSESCSRLLSAVDAAAFTAKDMGRDNIQIHNVENKRISSRRTILDWVGRISVLFEKNLIQLRCQKIQPTRKSMNSLPHYEVLLDVQDEEGNKVPLEEFIVSAERYNRINDIDTWVVDYVLDWMEERKDKLHRIRSLSINLSGSSVGNRRFMEHVESKLNKPGFPANKVCFEVTETVAINNLEVAARFMKKLKQTGCQFSLDDFGSGSASYSYLKSLPIDYLKIDGSFVKDIGSSTYDYAVVKSINEIGHAMGKETVAEYVENEFTHQTLKQIGIDYVQGFGIEKPIALYKLFG